MEEILNYLWFKNQHILLKI